MPFSLSKKAEAIILCNSETKEKKIPIFWKNWASFLKMTQPNIFLSLFYDDSKEGMQKYSELLEEWSIKNSIEFIYHSPFQNKGKTKLFPKKVIH